MTGFARNLEVGYFRDAYNNSNVLWQFDLSYWTDLKDLVNKDNEMYPSNIAKFLLLLEDRESVFEQNLSDLLERKNKIWDYEQHSDKEPTYKPDESIDEERTQWIEQYRKDYAELKAFLQKAIDMGSPIICSL